MGPFIQKQDILNWHCSKYTKWLWFNYWLGPWHVSDYTKILIIVYQWKSRYICNRLVLIKNKDNHSAFTDDSRNIYCWECQIKRVWAILSERMSSNYFFKIPVVVEELISRLNVVPQDPDATESCNFYF